ncbi:unnamed protein product [Zymoseptoria tritici ST99CH_3D1]|nr:unnamed protein product [Zymoseptoria tritici ST99CH_3D1]
MEAVEELARSVNYVQDLSAPLTHSSTFVDDALISIELEDGGRFTVQRATLCQSSEYFRKALRGDFQEASNNKLKIPGCTSESFRLILYWICNSNLPDWTTALKQNKMDAHSRQLCLAKLWLTSDMLLMVRLQNETMRKLRSITNIYTISHEAMSCAFDSAPHDSPILQVLLQDASRDFFSATGTYTSEEMDAFGSIPGFLQAFIEIGERLKINNHYHMKVPVSRDEDSKFEVKPAAKNN